MRTRNWISGIAVLGAVAAFGVAPSLAGESAAVVQGAAALVALAIVGARALRGDEVERQRLFRAAGVAFAISLAAALLARIFGASEAGLIVNHAWAFMMGAWLVAWASMRMWLS